MALVVPEKGKTREVARKLLDLATTPGEVQTTADGPDGVSFVVPDDLYDRYMDDEEKTPAATTDEGAPTPKRRGRPPGSKNRTKDVEAEE